MEKLETIFVACPISSKLVGGKHISWIEPIVTSSTKSYDKGADLFAPLRTSRACLGSDLGLPVEGGKHISWIEPIIKSSTESCDKGADLLTPLSSSQASPDSDLGLPVDGGKHISRIEPVVKSSTESCDKGAGLLAPLRSSQASLGLDLALPVDVIKKEFRKHDDNTKCNAFALLAKFKSDCRAILQKNSSMQVLFGLMECYRKIMQPIVYSCYKKTSRASKLKLVMSEIHLFFHMYYSSIKLPSDRACYLEIMSDLMTMYVDMEIKASCTKIENVKKIASIITSSFIVIFGDNADEYILDTMLKSQMISKQSSSLSDLVFRRVLRNVPSYFIDALSFIRYLLVFKLWKSIVKPEQKPDIKKLAIKLLNPPDGFKERVSEVDSLKEILPKIPMRYEGQEITSFLMNCQFLLSAAIKNYFKASLDPKVFLYAGRTIPNSHCVEPKIEEIVDLDVDYDVDDVSVVQYTTLKRDFPKNIEEAVKNEVFDTSLNNEINLSSHLYEFFEQMASAHKISLEQLIHPTRLPGDINPPLPVTSESGPLPNGYIQYYIEERMPSSSSTDKSTNFNPSDLSLELPPLKLITDDYETLVTSSTSDEDKKTVEEKPQVQIHSTVPKNEYGETAGERVKIHRRNSEPKESIKRKRSSDCTEIRKSPRLIRKHRADSSSEISNCPPMRNQINLTCGLLMKKQHHL